MLLRLIKYHPLFAYSVGDEFEVNEKDTQTLLDGEYAVPASASEPAPAAQVIETSEARLEQPENASIQFQKKQKHNKNK
jgi:hypothetical protein